MSFRDFDGRVAECSSSIARNTTNQIDNEPSIPIPEAPLGVRPHLMMRCPISGKMLIEESYPNPESFDTCSSATRSEEDDGYQHVQELVDERHDAYEVIQTIPVIPSPQTTKSSYSQLATAIANFQKMVANLEEVLENAGRSPEFQWKSRILVRSVQEANRDIRTRLQATMNSRQNTAYAKLNRDYSRAQKILQATLKDQERRQQAEVSLLFSANKEESKNEEEFFDRMMREREQEVKKINISLQKVNKIYEVCLLKYSRLCFVLQ